MKYLYIFRYQIFGDLKETLLPNSLHKVSPISHYISGFIIEKIHANITSGPKTTRGFSNIRYLQIFLTPYPEILFIDLFP